ncbi:hypothetical protein [Streptosporangium sp. NPDC001681]|uniref:hypothetical protein n=1 Tax=Streptosporangium sp. NPDC001681 TaxID=3154395 RepID=UPI003317180B
MTTATYCNCDYEEAAIGPCPTHHADDYQAWLTERAPRLAAAEAADDPFLKQLGDNLPYAEDIPEFTPLRSTLSEPARELFDRDWENGLIEPWPDSWELALKIRDEWPTLVLPQERDAARLDLAKYVSLDDYPFGAEETSGHENDPYDGGISRTPEQLLEEADQLAELARRATQLEKLLRDHAAGGTTRADQMSTETA